MAHPDDIVMMKQIANGDESALRNLINQYCEMVHRTAMNILCDREESNDVTQETFIKLWYRAAQYNPRYAIATWLYRIACNLCYDRLRRRRLWQWVPFLPEKDERQTPAADCSMESNELWEIFGKASSSLPPKQRIVFALRELEGLTAEQTAEILQMTPEQVKANLYSAKKNVQSQLKRYGIQ